MRDEAVDIEIKARIDSEAARYALRLAAEEAGAANGKDVPPDEVARRARWLAFAALRGVAPRGRSIEQALLLGWPEDEAWRVSGQFSDLRQAGRSKRGVHWFRGAKVERIESALRVLLAGGEAARRGARAAAAMIDSRPAGAPARALAMTDRRAMERRAEEARRAARALRPSIGVLMGDPPPGRSALDRRRAEGRA